MDRRTFIAALAGSGALTPAVLNAYGPVEKPENQKHNPLGEPDAHFSITISGAGGLYDWRKLSDGIWGPNPKMLAIEMCARVLSFTKVMHPQTPLLAVTLAYCGKTEHVGRIFNYLAEWKGEDRVPFICEWFLHQFSLTGFDNCMKMINGTGGIVRL